MDQKERTFDVEGPARVGCGPWLFNLVQWFLRRARWLPGSSKLAKRIRPPTANRAGTLAELVEGLLTFSLPTSPFRPPTLTLPLPSRGSLSPRNFSGLT